MLRRVAVLTFFLNCCEMRVKACIWKRYASGIVHHGGLMVVCLGPVVRAGVGVGGLAVYMTHNGGRGAIVPISTFNVCSWGRVSKFVTASLAYASAKSVPRMSFVDRVWRVVQIRVSLV